MFRSPSGPSNGLTLDREGRLLACELACRISRTEENGDVITLAERYQGKRINSPNDIVVKSDGGVYFTDPVYGLRRTGLPKELDFNGVYRIEPDGALTNGRLFAELRGPGKGVSDGLKVDSQGNIYCTGPGGIWVLDEAGEKLGILNFPEAPANLAWGDADLKTVYVTARTGIYRLRTQIRGAILSRPLH